MTQEEISLFFSNDDTNLQESEVLDIYISSLKEVKPISDSPTHLSEMAFSTLV